MKKNGRRGRNDLFSASVSGNDFKVYIDLKKIF